MWLLPAALVYTLFPVYGSLMPFLWQHMPMDEALRRFATILGGPMMPDSRADFAANVLLALPLAVLWLAVLTTGRRRKPWVGAAVAVWLSCTALALALEFSQLFFSGRLPALSDFVAQSLGALAGVGVWRLIPSRFWFVSSNSGSVWRSVQALYLAGVALYALMPLDLTVSLSELVGKFKLGMVRLVPFSGFAAEPGWALVDMALDTAIWLGAAVLTRLAFGRLTAQASIALLLFATVLETAQILVLSRVVDTTDVLMAAIGLFIGYRLSGRRELRRLGSGGSALSVGSLSAP